MRLHRLTIIDSFITSGGEADVTASLATMDIIVFLCKLTIALCTEGSWDDVTRLIGQAHTILHDKGIVRIQTDIRIGSRTDKAQTMEDKVAAVEKLLASEP